MGNEDLQAEVLTVDEAAAILRRNPQTVYRLVRRGAIPSVRVGGRIVVPRSRLAAMLGRE